MLNFLSIPRALNHLRGLANWRPHGDSNPGYHGAHLAERGIIDSVWVMNSALSNTLGVIVSVIVSRDVPRRDQFE